MSLFNANAEKLTFLKEEGILRIPFFQRRYVWDDDNWEELYDNFFDSDIPGFLGSIILKNKVDRKPGEPNECTVIDGQQRLTTISIFLVALYDSLNKDDQSFFISHLRSVLYNSEEKFDSDGDIIYVPKIIHSHLDKDEFDFVMDIKNQNKIKEKNEENLINRCYEYFYNKFIEEDYEKKKNLFKNLIVNASEILVVIGISGDADEQKVFDTLNSSGVKLTMADTIKNYLFDKATKIFDVYIQECNNLQKMPDFDSVIALYDNTWMKTFLITDEIEKKWSKENVTGRITRTNVDLFLHCFATIKRLYDPDEDNLDDLPKIYKRYIDGINTYEKLKGFLDELCKYGNLYFSTFVNRDINCKYSWDKGLVLSRLLLFIDTIGTKTFNPYILYLIDKYPNDSDNLNNYLHKIEKIIVYTYLTNDKTRSKNYNKLCMNFIEKDNRIDEELSKITDLDSCIIGLQKMNNTEAKVLLFIIELYRRRDEKSDIRSLEFDEEYQLEHVMPIKWEKNWVKLPEKNDYNEPLNTVDEKRDYRNSKIKMLGNMTILKGKLNLLISNANFDIKINGSEDGDGIREFASLKITSDDIVKYYDEGNEWDEIRINERTRDLLNEIKKALLY